MATKESGKARSVGKLRTRARKQREGHSGLAATACEASAARTLAPKWRRGQQGSFAFEAAGKRRRTVRSSAARRPNVRHVTRPWLDRTYPTHVTLRAHRSAPSFRSGLVALLAKGVFEELSILPDPDERVFAKGAPPGLELAGPRLERAARACAARRQRHHRDRAVACLGLPRKHDPQRRGQVWSRRKRATDCVAEGFDVVHFSLQHDHIHLIVEAVDARALSCGMRRLIIRLANRINAVVRRSRKGKIWADRYHRHDLCGPRAVRNALVYVLQNGRKHGVVDEGGIDYFSSAHEHDGWADLRVERPPRGLAPRTWLLRVGWRRGGGLLRVSESPRRSPLRA